MLTVCQNPTDSAETLDQTCEFKVVWDKGNKLNSVVYILFRVFMLCLDSILVYLQV